MMKDLGLSFPSSFSNIRLCLLSLLETNRERERQTDRQRRTQTVLLAPYAHAHKAALISVLGLSKTSASLRHEIHYCYC